MKVRNAYVHFPFCAKKCLYCDFAVHAVGNLPSSRANASGLMDRYLSVVKDEIRMELSEVDGHKFDTVYFGGGTPSLLSPDQLQGVL